MSNWKESNQILDPRKEILIVYDFIPIFWDLTTNESIIRYEMQNLPRKQPLIQFRWSKQFILVSKMHNLISVQNIYCGLCIGLIENSYGLCFWKTCDWRPSPCLSIPHCSSVLLSRSRVSPFVFPVHLYYFYLPCFMYL